MSGRSTFAGSSTTSTRECTLSVDPTLTVTEAHGIAVDAEHRLIRAIARLAGALIHTDPQAVHGIDRHKALAHHSRA
jgi:divalent metal cation (Fe/Co/Zn/Cd) transporter